MGPAAECSPSISADELVDKSIEGELCKYKKLKKQLYYC